MPGSLICPLTGANGTPLPLELLRMICQLLPFKDKKSLACVSWALWRVAATCLWRNIGSLELLVALMLDQTTVKSIVLGPMFEAGVWPTLERIGPFVLSLKTYDKERETAAYSTRDVMRVLVERSTVARLFPNLRSLSVGQTWLDWNPWLLEHRNLHFFSAFMCPSVTRLHVEGDMGSFEIAELQRSAPDVRELHLDLGEFFIGPFGENGERDDGWITTTMAGLIHWEHLAALTISTVLLNNTTANLVGSIPSLTTLTVLGDTDPRWEKIPFGPTCFPRLRKLCTKGVHLSDLISFLDQPYAPRNLTKLYLYLVIGGTMESTAVHIENLILCLCNRHPQLSAFVLTTGLRVPAAVLQPLADLPLRRLSLWGVDFCSATLPLLQKLHGGLTSLDLEFSAIPPSILRGISTAYPCLRALRVRLDIEAQEGLEDQEGLLGDQLRSKAEGPLHMYLGLYIPSNYDLGRATKDRRAIYRLATQLWNDVTLSWN